MKKSSLIIPLYNEEENIDYLINELVELKVYDLIEDVIFVDDASKDNSLNKLIKHSKNLSKIKYICHDENLGQSRSLFDGAKISENEILIFIDGDNQINPKDIIKLHNIFINSDDVKLVSGIRVGRKDTISKKIASILANKVRDFILKDGSPDTGCPLKIADKEIFLSFPYFSGLHRFLPALFGGLGHKVMYCNIEHRPRKYGVSKYGLFKRFLAGIIDIYKVKKIIQKYKL